MPRWTKEVVAPRAPVSRHRNIFVKFCYELAGFIFVVVVTLERRTPGGQICPARAICRKFWDWER